jgi:hypothetical protein
MRFELPAKISKKACVLTVLFKNCMFMARAGGISPDGGGL